MEKFAMKFWTFVKVVINILLLSGLVLGNMLIFAYVFEDPEWIAMGFLAGFAEFIVFMWFCFPRLFKDYTEYYWNKKEERECLEKGLENQRL